MLEIEAVDGRRAWLNVLLIKSVEVTTKPNDVTIIMADDTAVHIKGEAASIAADVTRLLRAVHGGS